MMENQMQGPMKQNFFDKVFTSGLDAFSAENLLKRIVFGLVFGLILGFKYIILFLDNNMKMVADVLMGKWYYYLAYFFVSLGQAVWKGVQIGLASVWQVIVNPSIYVSNHSVGSIIFAVVIGLLLVAFFFQPVSVFMDIFDMKIGQAWGIVIRTIITIMIVLGISAWVYYSGNSEIIISSVSNSSIINNVSTNISINLSQQVNTSSIINLL